MRQPEGRPRVVVISPELPHRDVAHAGGRYVATLVETLEAGAEVLVLVPDTPVNRAAETSTGLPRHLVVGRRSDRPPWLRPAFRALALVDAALQRRDPSRLATVFVAGLVTTARARHALRTADVVDLQWSATARLQPLVRLLNRRATVVATFHDVRTGRFLRAADREPDPDAARALRRAARAEARAQRRLLRGLDAVITFSDKDAVELAQGAPRNGILVVPPPLARLDAPVRARAARPTAVFVGHLARPENEDAVAWLLDDIWPRVSEVVPDAVLRVVGGGAGPGLARRLAQDPTVTAPGYVEDLAAEYSRAWLCVVPVRDGAGVKFKTVEAVVAGVPVVTTPIGAEGVAAPGAFAACTDGADDFAAACVRVLRHPDSAEEHAATTARWARQRFSHEGFERTVRTLYLGGA